MKPRFLFIVAGVAAVTTAFAFNLGDLGKAITDQVKGTNSSSTPNVIDTVKGVAKASDPISIEEETAIGESVALEVIGKFGGLVRDKAMTRRVNLIGQAVARYSDRPELAWRFGVLDSDTVNALSAPGGFVFITRALYKQATTDDELAGILGHEITHITRKHALGIVKRGQWLSAGGSVLGQVNSTYRNTKSKVDAIDSNLKQFDVGIGDMVNGIIVKGFDAPTEYEADKGGRAVANVTGYAPGGLRAILVQLKAQGGDPKKFFSTHPPLDERIKRLPDEPAKLAANP